MKTETRIQLTRNARNGAVMPMFGLMLPVLFILSAFAINMAYMQLVSTEMKIASDAAAHAGGRAMSVLQTTDEAIAYAADVAAMNSVGGDPLVLSRDADDQIEFGRSVRGDNGYGRYEFTKVSKAAVDAGTERATSISVNASKQVGMVFNAIPGISAVTTSRISQATQVDRDIALVLDRSGSMLYYRDDEGLTDQLYELYNTWITETEEGHWEYGYWSWSNRRRRWRWRGYYKPEDAHYSWQIRDPNDRRWVEGTETTRRAISWDEYEDATAYLYDRRYSENVIDQLNEVNVDMAAYTHDWEHSNTAPRFSRWYYLDLGVTAFLDVLEVTDQEEHVSLVTFASTAQLEYGLKKVYDDIRDKVSTIVPYGGTAIGDGMETGLPPIIDGEAARTFAAKTIVVLTDGESNSGKDPGQAVRDIIGSHNVTIHTVTFSKGANKEAMEEVAEIGRGRHYHADDGSALIEIFEEIANNLPTILTF